MVKLITSLIHFSGTGELGYDGPLFRRTFAYDGQYSRSQSHAY